MPIFKCNWFFVQNRWGWTDTFYLNKSTTQEALDSAETLAPLRVALLGGLGEEASPYLAQIRVSDIEIQRDSLVKVPAPGDSRPRVAAHTADIPSTAILARVESGALYRRQWYLRGQPDVLVQPDGNLSTSTYREWFTAFNRFANGMVAAGAGIYAVTKPPAGTLIDAITGATGVIAITTAAAHGLVTNDSVRVVSAPGTTGIVGNWRVFVVSPTTFNLLGSGGSGTTWLGYLGGGKFYKRVAGLQAFSSIQVERATKKSTGGPFDRPVGRRRRKAKA